MTGGAGPRRRRRVGRTGTGSASEEDGPGGHVESIVPGPSCSLNAPEPERLMPPTGVGRSADVGRLMRHMPARISRGEALGGGELVVQQAAVSP